MAKRRNPQAATLLTADDEEVAAGNPLPVTLTAADLVVGRVKITDGIDVAEVDTLGNLWGPKSIKTVTGTVSANTDIVPAVGGKRIKVFYMKLLTASTSANTITMQSGASIPLDTSVLQAPATGSVFGLNVVVQPPAFLFATAVGEKLTLNVSDAINVTYTVSYWDDDAA